MPKRSALKKHFYGMKRDHHDPRDVQLMAAAPGTPLPESVDLRSKLAHIPILNQGSLGSCVAHATVVADKYAMELLNTLENDGDPDPQLRSRLMVYYNARLREGTARQDAGCMIRDAIRSLAAEGVCPETAWPYVIQNFARRPPKSCYDAGKKAVITEYRRCIGSHGVKSALANGYPVVIGFQVYENMESAECAKSGIVKVPRRGEACLGGHAVLVEGYTPECAIIRNSWGTEWGLKGYFYLPLEYLDNPKLGGDFWAIMKSKDENDA